MRYALIGCGRISPNHLAAAKTAGFDIVGLCDSNIANAQKIASLFDLDDSVMFFSDYREMLLNLNLDVVSIATPSGSHAEIAVTCCERGIGVIIEKPVALSISDAYRIKDVAEKHHVKVTVCHQNRFNQAVLKAMDTVNDGHLGKRYCISANVLWNRNIHYYKQSSWRGTWEQDGGVLMNQGIHNIDLLRWFAGSDVSEVHAYTGNVAHPYIKTEDIGIAIVKFKNGCLGTINCTSNVYPENLEETLYIMGETGTIKLGGKSVNKIETFDVLGFENSSEIIANNSNNPPNVYGYGHSPLFVNFAKAILDDEKPFITIEDAIKSLELVLGIYKATINGGVAKFPIGDFSTMKMGVITNGI